MAASFSSDQPIVQIRDLAFSWPRGDSSVLDIEELTVHRGERVFLRGSSGSGKTTLLNLVAAVLKARKGSILVNEVDVNKLPNRHRDTFRADNIGFIFQQFNLLPFLSVIENVSLPCRFSSIRKKRVLEESGSIDTECLRLLEAMQLSADQTKKASVNQLSVGQQQRVAVARIYRVAVCRIAGCGFNSFVRQS